MIKFIKISFAFIVITVTLALCISATDKMNLDFPTIDESGSIVGLSNFYCPLVSDNFFETFSDGFGELVTEPTSKFTVNAIQGGGRYPSNVLRSDKFDFSNLSLNFDDYFTAFSFSGLPISVNISLSTDVDNKISVFSNKALTPAGFVDGVLSVDVNEPQILKVVFDDSVGKSLYIFIGDAQSFSASDVADFLENGSDSSLGYKTEQAAKYSYPLKVAIDNNIVYYPAIYSNETAYISDELYSGEYSGNEAISHKGETYLPISAFVGNGNIVSADYDEAFGIIRLTSKEIESMLLSEFKASASSKVAESEGIIEYVGTAQGGIFTEIAPALLMNSDSLKFTVMASTSGEPSVAKIRLAVIGYNSLGKTEVISEASTRVYSKAYDSTSYFDVSSMNGEYEGFYFAIIIDEETDTVINMSNLKLEIFKISTGIGDNEFNPF